MTHRALFLTTAVVAALLLGTAPTVRADDVAGPETAAGVAFEPGTPAFADVLAKAKAEGKPAFIDFSTAWCGWCRKLEKDTFSQAPVAEVMKGFVNVHVDAEKGEGPGLAKRYGVRGYPTLVVVVVDADGAEVDRIVGYRAPEAFLTEVRRILAGEGTLPALRKRFAEHPDDVDLGVTLASKLAASDAPAAAAVFDALATSAATKDAATQARVRLEHAAVLLETGKVEDAAAMAESLVKDFPETPSAGKAAARLGGAFVRLPTARALAFLDAARPLAKEAEDRVAVERVTMAVLQSAVAASLKRQAEAAGDDPQMLNAVAWDCFERKLNVREAVGWARTAVEKSGRDAAILDTLANLLWLTGERAEAVKLETEASGKAEGAMKREFDANVAKWTGEIRAAEKEHGEDEDGEGAEEDEDGEGPEMGD